MNKQIPDKAKLKKYIVKGELEHKPIWNKKTQRYDIELLDFIDFYLIEHNCIIRLKKGFVCDGASIPQLFWSTTGSPYASKFLLPALLHDGTYCIEAFDRNVCDWIFLDFMDEIGVCAYTRNKMYLAVRYGGRKVWKKHNEYTIELNKKYVKKMSILGGN